MKTFYIENNIWYRMQTTCMQACLHVSRAIGVRVLQVKNKFNRRSINLSLMCINGTIYAYSIQCFHDNERKSWICPFCLVLVYETRWKERLQKGFEKSCPPCGILFKTVQRRPTVDLTVRLILFMVQCGYIALLEAENKVIYWRKDHLPTMLPKRLWEQPSWWPQLLQTTGIHTLYNSYLMVMGCT